MRCSSKHQGLFNHFPLARYSLFCSPKMTSCNNESTPRSKPVHNIYKGFRWDTGSTRKSIDDMERFEPRQDDVIVVTFPKSGTHWMQEVVRLIFANGCPDDVDRTLQSFALEMVVISSKDDDLDSAPSAIDSMSRDPSPRVMVTHCPLKIFPRQIWDVKCPVIYVARNLRDVIVSMFNYLGKAVDPHGNAEVESFDSLFKEYLEGKSVGGSWFDHVQGYWSVQEQNPDNFLFVTYEEMQKDLRSVALKVMKLLKHELSEEGLQKVLENSTIAKMKENQDRTTISPARILLKSINAADFLQQGKCGKWKAAFSDVQNKKFDQVYSEKMAAYPDLAQRLTFSFENT